MCCNMQVKGLKISYRIKPVVITCHSHLQHESKSKIFRWILLILLTQQFKFLWNQRASFLPCSTGQGFLVLQDTGPYWVAGEAFCGLGKTGKGQTAVALDRDTAWVGLGTGPRLPYRDRTAVREIPACKKEKEANIDHISIIYCIYTTRILLYKVKSSLVYFFLAI